MKAQNKKSRKILAGLLSSAVILGASGTSGIPLGLSAIAEPAESGVPVVQAEQGPIGGNFCDWVAEDGSKPFADNETSWRYEDGVLTISGEGKMPNWGWVNGTTTNPVRPWQNFKDQIKTIVIEDGVTSIGGFAFSYLYNNQLVDVKIGKDVETIEYCAFYNSNLTEVIIPANVKEMHDQAFANCWNLESVTLTNNTQDTNSNAFKDCGSLKYKTSLESFSNNSIPGTNLSWSYDVKTHTLEITGNGAIPNYSHTNPDHSENDRPWQGLRRHIANIVIDDGVTSIGEYAFCDIWGHQLLDQPLNITFGSGVTKIGESAFNNCYMTEVTIPKNVAEIQDKAFYNNWALESVLLSNKTNIGDSVFASCPGGNNLMYLEYISGKFCEWTVTTDDGVEHTPFSENTLSWSYDTTTHTLTISGNGPMPDWDPGNDTDNLKGNNPKHWQNRPWNAFTSQIEKVVVENGVTTLGARAFSHLNYDGVIVEIPEGVKTIGTGAFYESYGLKQIAIPASVQWINNEAFWHCQKLENVTFSENSQLEEIGSSGFRDCQALNNITLPKSLKKIHNGAFKQCNSLEEI